MLCNFKRKKHKDRKKRRFRIIKLLMSETIHYDFFKLTISNQDYGKIFFHYSEGKKYRFNSLK